MLYKLCMVSSNYANLASGHRSQPCEKERNPEPQLCTSNLALAPGHRGRRSAMVSCRNRKMSRIRGASLILREVSRAKSLNHSETLDLTPESNKTRVARLSEAFR